MTGTADYYTEMLHPTGDLPGIKKPSMINYVASGSLEDGRSFFVHAEAVDGHEANVRISFR